jgi:hypothetical protein
VRHVEGCSEQVAEIIKVEGVMDLKVFKNEGFEKERAPDNDEICCSIPCMSRW